VRKNSDQSENKSKKKKKEKNGKSEEVRRVIGN